MFIRGTTLITSSSEEIPSDSSKSYPCNGGNRVPLLGKHRSQNRLGKQIESNVRTGSHQPPALWSIHMESGFPSMSLSCIRLSLNHKLMYLSTGNFPVFRRKKPGKLGRKIKMNLFEKNI